MFKFMQSSNGGMQLEFPLYGLVVTFLELNKHERDREICIEGDLLRYGKEEEDDYP